MMSFVKEATCKFNSPVNNPRVINLKFNSEDQTDDEQPVNYDRRGRGRFRSEGLKNEFF